MRAALVKAASSGPDHGGERFSAAGAPAADAGPRRCHQAGGHVRLVAPDRLRPRDLGKCLDRRAVAGVGNDRRRVLAALLHAAPSGPRSRWWRVHLVGSTGPRRDQPADRKPPEPVGHPRAGRRAPGKWSSSRRGPAAGPLGAASTPRPTPDRRAGGPHTARWAAAASGKSKASLVSTRMRSYRRPGRTGAQGIQAIGRPRGVEPRRGLVPHGISTTVPPPRPARGQRPRAGMNPGPNSGRPGPAAAGRSS